jgi:hypothetical protein
LAPKAANKIHTGRPLQVGEQRAASLGIARRAHSNRCTNLSAGNRR